MTGQNRPSDRPDGTGRRRSRREAGTPRHGSARTGSTRSATAPSRRRRHSDPARLTAWRVLRTVSRDDAYANLTMPQEIRRARLDRRDAGFATELAYGALRAQGTYDAVIAACVDRPLEAIDPPVLDALRLGAHQLLAMRVDAHAAVSETVALVRGEIGTGPSGFVNAVLRRISAQDHPTWIREISEAQGLAEGSVEELALRLAHPTWVVRALGQSLRLRGRETELPDLLAADNTAAEVHLVGLPGVGESQLAAAVDAGAVPSTLLPSAAKFSGGDVGRLPGVREGELRVQDLGSQWVARALAGASLAKGPAPEDSASEPPAQRRSSPRDSVVEEVTPRVRAEQWLDLCAGPGGKAALLAALAAQRGATVLANEPIQHRAELVRSALSPIEASAVTVGHADGRTIAEDLQVQAMIAAGGGFDRILIDAPCTGLGALRRRPEARWRRTPRDLADLTVLQEQLLDAAVEVLAPGGLLAYVTCSPHLAETTLAVEDLLRRRPELELIDAHDAMRAACLPSADARLEVSGSGITAKVVQLWPHVHGTDAMFFALFHRPLTHSGA